MTEFPVLFWSLDIARSTRGLCLGTFGMLFGCYRLPRSIICPSGARDMFPPSLCPVIRTPQHEAFKVKQAGNFIRANNTRPAERARCRSHTELTSWGTRTPHYRV